jgi:hypothetical protein
MSRQESRGSALDLIRAMVEAIEARLADSAFVVMHTFIRNERSLNLALTDRLRRLLRRARLWKSKEMLATLKNAEYGYDPARSRSRGGADGIWKLDQSFQNEMTRKLFSYIKKDEADQVAAALSTTRERLIPVRLVSHHMRLLGVLHSGVDADWLVLVDFDRSES